MSTFEAQNGPILKTLLTGASVADAAAQHGVSERTIERWLARGREEPDGPYGDFAAAVDKQRDRAALPPRDGLPLDREELLLILSEKTRA